VKPSSSTTLGLARRCLQALAGLLAAGIAPPASAVLWDGGGTTSDWIEPANWQFNLVPTTADTATISNGDTATIAGRTVPTIMAAEFGMGSLPGGLTITGGVNPGGLNVVTSVSVAGAGTLTLGGGGPAASQVSAATLTTSGTVTVLSRGTVNLSGQLTQTGGTINLNSGVINASSIVVQSGLFNATGDITGNVSIGDGSGAVATLAPGQMLDINGAFKLAPDSRLEIQFRSGVIDQIDVSGTATLGGTLNLSFLGGVGPQEGASYSVISAGNVVGSFDEILGSDSGGDGSWIPDFDLTNGFNVSYTELRGNMNGDNTVDELDVELFAHAVRDPNSYHTDFYLQGDVADAFLADMDGDGSNTFADIPPFLEVIENFGGSSQAALAAITRVLAVPEPTGASVAWVLGAVICLTGRMRCRTRGQPR
jgi:hypothetical protein